MLSRLVETIYYPLWLLGRESMRSFNMLSRPRHPHVTQLVHEGPRKHGTQRTPKSGGYSRPIPYSSRNFPSITTSERFPRY
jgi:hypothetical protein